MLLKRFFIQVEALDYFVRVLVLDSAIEHIAAELELLDIERLGAVSVVL